MADRTLVIVGAGLAGATAAETLRTEGDVTDTIQDLVRAGPAGATVDRAALADSAVPLQDLTR